MLDSSNAHLETSPINTSTSSSNSSSSSISSFNNNKASDINNNSNKLVNSNTVTSGLSNNSNMHVRTASMSDMDHEMNYDDFKSQTNLIVNFLPQNMSQDEIKAMFSNMGPVESCKLIKDKLSGQSLGYAFVNYTKPDDANKAINSLNGMRLQNKTIKVSLARPSSEAIKGANLYVCGLHKDFSESDLENMFTSFGTIISYKILTDPKTGVSKGVGFVRFDQRNEAEMAIAKLNGTMPDNVAEPLVVKFANSPTSAKTVMGLPLAPFVQTCRGFYQPFRSSTNASYRYSPMNGYCPESQHQPSPLVSQLSVISASNQNISNTTNCSIGGALTPTTLVPSLSNNNIVSGSSAAAVAAALASVSSVNSNYSGWCIFVYNLGPETDEGILWQLFGPFGAVQNVKIIRDGQTQKCKGFGFVTMTNYDEAALAINCLHGFNLQNRILQVSFKTNNGKLF